MVLQFHKVVGSLPDTLIPNAIYAVRVGHGVSIYFVDSSGLNAFPLNVPAGSAPLVAPAFGPGGSLTIETETSDMQITVTDDGFIATAGA